MSNHLVFIKAAISFRINQLLRKMIKRQVYFQTTIDSSLAFCIVHWNAPDFLLLTVEQIQKMHPNSKIYVLDNGSNSENFLSIFSSLQKYGNVTLFGSVKCPCWAKKLRLEKIWQNHAAGLQYLLNYSVAQRDELAVFLDQDCVLCKPLDELFIKFTDLIVLIGARDYLLVPYDYGPLKEGKLRDSYHLVHPSFMILQPERIHKLYGNNSLFDVRSKLPVLYSKNATPEPYHGLSFKAAGRILFLESQMHSSIPLLTRYSYGDVAYAWHAWYSSRATNVRSGSVDGYSLSWLADVRDIEYKFMFHILNN